MTVVDTIVQDKTNLEMTFSGQEIAPTRMRIIFKALESNTSLKVKAFKTRN